MEILLILTVAAILLVSVQRTSTEPPRSRYDPLPKPPASISRTYRGEVGEAIARHEMDKKT